jgi:hypothetical protein
MEASQYDLLASGDLSSRGRMLGGSGNEEPAAKAFKPMTMLVIIRHLL